jgi:hypothetical protein
MAEASTTVTWAGHHRHKDRHHSTTRRRSVGHGNARPTRRSRAGAAPTPSQPVATGRGLGAIRIRPCRLRCCATPAKACEADTRASGSSPWPTANSALVGSTWSFFRIGGYGSTNRATWARRREVPANPGMGAVRCAGVARRPLRANGHVHRGGQRLQRSPLASQGRRLSLYSDRRRTSHHGHRSR